MTDDLDLSKPLTLTDPLAAARSRTVAEDGTVTIDVGKEYAGKIVDVGVSRAGNGPRTDGGESLVHPKLDDDLPDRPEYDTDAEAAIDDALVDLFVAARDGGDEYHHELAANLLGSHRLGDAKTLVTDGGQTVAPGAEDTPPAPSKDITVRPGGNGDQFLVFDDADEYRHVELLNDADARELYEKLGEALDSDGEELVTDGGQPDPGRRRDLVKQVLDTGFEDPLWLHNLAACSRFDDDAYDDLLDTAEQLRHDAELLEDAHEQIESGEIIPAEAAFYIATNVEFWFFKHDEYGDTRTDLFDSVPITEEP